MLTSKRDLCYPRTNLWKKCKYNKDCVSNRCVHTYSEQGDHQGKRCVVVKGMVIPKEAF